VDGRAKPGHETGSGALLRLLMSFDFFGCVQKIQPSPARRAQSFKLGFECS